MAIRSTGGTGVLVALVVFVLTTVFLLVMTIVFYAGRDEATVKMNEAEARLAEFITASQRGDDSARSVQAAATNERESVYGYLMKKQADGSWFTQVSLNHGHHHYQFLVDGKPTLDPRAQGVARNERNEKVSLLSVS